MRAAAGRIGKRMDAVHPGAEQPKCREGLRGGLSFFLWDLPPREASGARVFLHTPLLPQHLSACTGSPGMRGAPSWCGPGCPAALPRVSVEFLSLVTSHPERALVTESGLSQWRCPQEHAARRAAGTSAPSAPGCRCPAGTQPAGGGKKKNKKK